MFRHFTVDHNGTRYVVTQHTCDTPPEIRVEATGEWVGSIWPFHEPGASDFILNATVTDYLDRINAK